MIYVGSYGTRIVSWPAQEEYPCQAPSFLAMHPSQPVLYAVSEQEGGVLTAFHFGRPEPAAVVRTGGSSPCHVAVHDDGELLAVANYADGSVTLVTLGPDGLPTGEPLLHKLSGSGPNEERQAGPHAHFVRFVKDEVYVADLGSDSIVRLDFTGKQLGAIAFPPGSGPRHFTPGRPGHWFVSLELEASVRSYVEQADGVWREAGFAMASAAEGTNYPSHIETSAGGSLVYVANRGPNTITVFSADEQARLTVLGEVSVQGAWPRHFALTGDDLYVANQDGGTIVRFRIDDTGLPQDPQQLLSLDSPSCLLPR